ncbi:MAG: beta-mannanase, partial [Verrucomicrobiaceae bacterium]
GRVELRDGENEISVERGWGYYDVDYVELSPASEPPRLRSMLPKLSDPKATPETRRLYSDLLRLYGNRTLSGQYDEAESDFVRTTTGQTPAILGGDFMDYSPSRQPYFDKPLKDAVPSWIERVRKGQILTLSWHWNAPKDLIDRKEFKKPNGEVIDASWYRGFYTDATTFDVQKALADPASEDYRLILRDIDAIAEPLKRLQAAKVPVLWRPLHEADGRWFWWGAKGAEPCKALWRLMYRRMTEHHGLHNLIWVWNSPSPDWFPGDDTVDVMSVDLYPGDRRDATSAAWEEQLARFDGRKPLALAEFPGAPDVERMRRFGVRWLYFVSWTGSVGPKATLPEVLKGTYDSKFVKNAR